ncbi:hypothetical protein HELRODRAFT_175927 [Helobdella robusta]|uniref:Uncharacterized protein n=1 Tax=Helobdella robusta TaxID=6412 RepID=T1F9W8_HELRO|nr:hypothetical protein HELRODRAFT_175927 [Helobdella robusta]ESO00490.1 hypothetical protein HELRODRAFT_175927 [Helobdella robusta]
MSTQRTSTFSSLNELLSFRVGKLEYGFQRLHCFVFSSRLGDCLCYWVQMAATKFCGPRAFATSFHVKIFLRPFYALIPVTGDLLKTCGDGYTASRVTEQSYLGLTMLTSNEEEPKKCGLKTAHSQLFLK